MRNEIDQKEHKNKRKFSPKRAKDCCIQILLHIYKIQKNVLHKKRKSSKMERYLNLNNFSNRNAKTKTRFSHLVSRFFYHRK